MPGAGRLGPGREGRPEEGPLGLHVKAAEVVAEGRGRRAAARVAVTRSPGGEGSAGRGTAGARLAPGWAGAGPRRGAVWTGVGLSRLCSPDRRLGSRWATLLDDATAVGKQEKVTGVSAFCWRPESPGGGRMDNWGWPHRLEMPKAGIRAWVGEEPASGKEPPAETGVSGSHRSSHGGHWAGAQGTAAPTRPSGTCLPLQAPWEWELPSHSQGYWGPTQES